MKVNLKALKELRLRTGIGILKCKEALISSNGDVEKALTALSKETGYFPAEDPKMHQGFFSYLLNESNTEITIFEFKTKYSTSKQILDIEEDIKPIKEQLISDPDFNFTELNNKYTEHFKLLKTYTYKTSEGIIGVYLHTGQQLLGLVGLKGTKDSVLAHNIAMHLVAYKPRFFSPEDIPEFLKQDKRDGVYKRYKASISTAALSPHTNKELFIRKRLENKLSSWEKEICLYKQYYTLNPEIDISQLLHSNQCYLLEDLVLTFHIGYSSPITPHRNK